MVTYGTTAIPSDQITVLSGGTVAISVAFENSIGLMGGMDTANGTATAGNVVEVDSPSDAATKFGDGSELHEAVKLGFNNGAGTIYALPVTETSTTESFAATASGTLSNVPAFDPNVNTEHDITAQDTVAATSVTVNIVYDSPPTAPTDSDTMNLNPVTGEWEADESSDYDISYDYGDYSTTAMDPLLNKSPRIVGVLTENRSVVTDLATELNNRATNFDFMHGVGGAYPKVDAANYTDSIDERRISLVYPSRAYLDEAETDEERTVSAVAGYLASLPLGISSTNDSIGGFSGGFRNPLSGPQAAGDLIDAQVMPLLNYPPMKITKDMTTSTEPKFERVYGMQVIDEMTEISHQISREFVGDQNTKSNRNTLRRSHTNAYLGAENGSPPLLDDFTVSVVEDGSDPNKVNVEIGLDVVDVMDTIDVTVTVGDIVRSNSQQ